MIGRLPWRQSHELLRQAERFLLPNACIGCRVMMPAREPDGLMCDVCLTRMQPIGSGCDRCGQPLPPVGPCRFCADWSGALSSVRSAVWLHAESRALVHRLKYGHARRLGELAARIVGQRIEAPGRAALVPVPAARARLWERGYNQAEVIARGLATRWQLPVWTNVLARTSQARSQTTLTPMGRAANVSDAFNAIAPINPAVGTRNVVIVDDVLTTGATVDACARALSEAGWASITAVTFARALPYEMSASGY